MIQCSETGTMFVYCPIACVCVFVCLQGDFYCYCLRAAEWEMISRDTFTDGGPHLIYDHQVHTLTPSHTHTLTTSPLPRCASTLTLEYCTCLEGGSSQRKPLPSLPSHLAIPPPPVQRSGPQPALLQRPVCLPLYRQVLDLPQVCQPVLTGGGGGGGGGVIVCVW